MVLADPAAIENPFFRMVPDWAAAADDRAGDGRDRDRQPGGDHRRLFADAAGDPARPAAAARHPPYLGVAVGQIYMPRVNMALLIGVLLLVGAFRISSALASAYGIAVADNDGGRRRCWLHRHLEVWRWPLVAGGRPDRAVPHRRSQLLLANVLSVRGRLGAAAVRRRHGADHLYTWRRGTAHAHATRRGAPRCRSRPCSATSRRSRRRSCRAPRCS